MSKLIKIISIKKAKISLHQVIPRVRLLEYTNSLSDLAKNYPGFITTNSYWKNSLDYSKDNYNLELISISEWNTMNDWNNWFTSDDRYRIHMKYQNIIGREEFNILNKKEINDDTFLL